MTKRDKLKQIIAPIVKEILIECLSGANFQENEKSTQKESKKAALNPALRNRILEEHRKTLSGDFSQVENKIKVSEGIHRLSTQTKNGSLTESILSKLDESDYTDNGEASEDFEADAVISEMSSTWKAMMKS